MRYLDPKNDLTFKKVFGQHPHLLKSFLNALLPLEEGQHIVELWYLPSELVPEVPLFKNTIVDVRCEDNRGRQFIVEMQMLWTDSFKSRVLFNASKAYVSQLGKARHYTTLQPVYALSLINQNFAPASPDYYHHYRIVHTREPEQVLEGLEFIFVELPKFQARNLRDKRMQVLWLRYLTEMQDQAEQIPADLLAVSETAEAIEYLRESSFSRAELAGYDKYWDMIRSERTLLAGAEQDGIKRGRAEGKAEGLAQGRQAAAFEIARRLMETGVGAATVAEATGLTEEQVWQAAAGAAPDAASGA